MLGPTAKLLAEDLSQLGHQAIDLGLSIQNMSGLRWEQFLR